MDEVLSVLSTKFHRDSDAISHTALYLSGLAHLVKPTKRIDVLDDDPDNRVLECALQGKADAIVTGDKAMLKLREFEGIRIMSLKEYLEGCREISWRSPHLMCMLKTGLCCNFPSNAFK